MVHLSAFTYALDCTQRATPYFPQKIREGLFVQIEKNGAFGVGEFAPLRGFHSCGVADAVSQTKSLDTKAIARLRDYSDNWPEQESVEFFRDYASPVSHMLSMAMFHQALQKLRAPSSRMLQLAALIEVGQAPLAISLAQAYLAQGFSHLKIKVGSLPVNEEIKKISTIAAMAGKKIKLRLDANRQFSVDEARSFLKGIRRIPLEYFEEPCADLGSLKLLKEEFGVNLAVDESLTNFDDLDWLLDAGISHIIIKPGRFHNLFAAMALVRRAQTRGLKSIFSHCFESEFSSAIFALMIESLGLTEDAHGVVVDGIFRRGVFLQPLRSFRGQLSLESAFRLCVSPFLQDQQRVTQIL